MSDNAMVAVVVSTLLFFLSIVLPREIAETDTLIRVSGGVFAIVFAAVMFLNFRKMK